MVIQDVSAERQLVRAKDEFLAALGHELATPATNLVSYAELLTTLSYSDRDRQQMLETMVQEGRRLVALIRDFVDVQRGPLHPALGARRRIEHRGGGGRPGPGYSRGCAGPRVREVLSRGSG